VESKKEYFMIRRTLASAVLLAAVLFSIAGPAAAAPPAAPDLFRSLPAGDAVVTVDGGAVLGKALPALLASRPDTAKRLEAHLARFRDDFGIDLKQARQAALSASLFDGASREWVAAVDGAFDAVAAPGALGTRLDAFVKRETRFSVRPETREGVTLYVLPEREADGRVREEQAVAVLDAKTALIGTPAAVRRAVDAHKGKAASAAASAALVEAWSQSSAASPVRFGMLVEPLIKSELQRDPSNPFLKSVAGARFMFGTLGLAGDGGLALSVTTRTGTAEDARSVLATFEAFVELGKQLTADKPDLAALVDLVRLSASGNDVLLTATVPAGQLDRVIRLVDKNRPMVAAK
jgi:hypothetical protein